MNKRMFQVFDEMNVNDEKNNTATCACCFDMVSANTAKGGGHITMGVPAEAIVKIMNNEYKPILILLDYNEYKRLEAIPLEDTTQQRIEQLQQWRKEASLLLDPLLEWGQAQKDIPLGVSITGELLRRAKLYTESQQRIEQLEKALRIVRDWQLPATGQFWDDDKTQPMSFGACYGSNGERDFMRNIATEALTPKTSTDE